MNKLCTVGFAVTALVTCASAVAEPQCAAVSYDTKLDRLSITATDLPYRQAMACIGNKSGVGVFMDPEADHNITVALSDVPLEQALRVISRQVSYILEYGDTSTPTGSRIAGENKPLLVGVHILPKGKAQKGRLPSLLAIEGEAFIREKNRNMVPERDSKTLSIVQARWDARVSKLPAEQRARVLDEARNTIDKIDERRTEHQQRKQQRALERAKQDQHNQAMLNKLKAGNPELYDVRVRQLAERQSGWAIR